MKRVKESEYGCCIFKTCEYGKWKYVNIILEEGEKVYNGMNQPRNSRKCYS
jgi:hypothetical protein